MPRLKRKYPRGQRVKIKPTFDRYIRARVLLIAFAAASLFLVISFSRYLGTVSGEMASKEAKDIVVLSVNSAIEKLLSDGQLAYSSFVSIQTDDNGDVTAITTDTARVNALSSRLLSDIVSELGQGQMDIKVPLGTLSGVQLLQGRGPDIPVKIHMLTASRAGFRNEFVSAGINQTRHQIILDVTINVSVLIPWKAVSNEVVSEVLVAETVIVGKVPDTVIDWNK